MSTFYAALACTACLSPVLKRVRHQLQGVQNNLALILKSDATLPQLYCLPHNCPQQDSPTCLRTPKQLSRDWSISCHAALAALCASALSSTGLASCSKESRMALRKAGCCSRNAETWPPGTHLTCQTEGTSHVCTAPETTFQSFLDISTLRWLKKRCMPRK